MYLGGCADGRPGIAGIDLLLDRYGGRDTVYKIHIGFVHPSKKLPCIGRKAFDIAALTFGIDGVKGKRRLPGSGYTGNDYQVVTGYIQGDILKVMYTCTLYLNITLHPAFVDKLAKLIILKLLFFVFFVCFRNETNRELIPYKPTVNRKKQQRNKGGPPIV
jgi:hypothetical protein